MNPIRVLIVDDKLGYAEVLASCLSDTGWTIHVATSAEEALRILQRQSVDILASDFLMPEGMDGAQLANNALALQPNLYSIIFTGWNDRDFAVQALRAGVSEFLDKSDRLDEDLRLAIRRGIQTITLSRIGRELLEKENDSDIIDVLIASLADLRGIDACCLVVVVSEQETWRVERAVDLRAGRNDVGPELHQLDSAYRHVIEAQAAYLPPLFAIGDRPLRPYFETSRSIAVVPVTLRGGARGALGIEHHQQNRFSIEDLRFLNQIAYYASFAMERLDEQDRLRAEQEMSSYRRDLLARAALHEIKNPLNNLAAAIQVGSDAIAVEQQKSILENVARINAALNRLFKPLIRGENRPREDIDVAGTIQDAISRFRLYHPQSATVLEQISSALPTIVGHRTLLVSALVSLLDNGATAAAESQRVPELRIRADYAASRDQVEVLVTDNGAGISEQYIDRIFDYAFTTRDDSAHSGYGLAFVKDVVELSGGHVSVDSLKDRGTTFKLSFPAGTLHAHATDSGTFKGR